MTRGVYWLVCALSPLPFLICVIHFICKLQESSVWEGEFERIHAKAAHMQQIQHRESVLLAPLKGSDPRYLDRQLESLHFALPEIKKLEAMRADHPDVEKVIQRLKEERLVFVEEAVRSNELFREVELRQQQPIEVNEEDLKRLLCLIEGVTIWPYGPKEGRPLFIIKEFKLSKQELPSKEKVFLIAMQLIRREAWESK